MEEEITLLPSGEDQNDLIWEENHKKITECMRKVLREDGSMPSMSHIASVTGLNRKTVKKHIEEFSTAPTFKEEAGKYKLFVGEVLNNVCRMAMRDNVKAARLFMELMGILKTKQVANHNFIIGDTGYVEVNSVKITKEVINGLNWMEKVQIEDIISCSIHNREVDRIEAEIKSAKDLTHRDHEGALSQKQDAKEIPAQPMAVSDGFHRVQNDNETLSPHEERRSGAEGVDNPEVGFDTSGSRTQ